MKTVEQQTIENACEAFLEELGEFATNKNLFPTLAKWCESRRLKLEAHQSGIRGTEVFFVRLES